MMATFPTSRQAIVPDDIWCAIPVYNNAATIGDVVQRCRRQLANVIVVDDGSSDADLRELLKDSGSVVLRHEHNLGKGAALLTAMRYVAQGQGRYLITLDGDGQHFPEDIPQFIAALAPNTILLGDRQQVSGKMPSSSRFGRAFSDFWIRLETGAAIRDTQSGFRAYPVGPISQMRFCSRHYNFEVEVLTRSIWAGLHVKNMPIRVWYPDASPENFQLSSVPRQPADFAAARTAGGAANAADPASPTLAARRANRAKRRLKLIKQGTWQILILPIMSIHVRFSPTPR